MKTRKYGLTTLNKKKALCIVGAELLFMALLLTLCVKLLMPSTLQPDAASASIDTPDTAVPINYASPHTTETPLLVTSSSEKKITVSFAGDCTLGTDEQFNYSTSLNAYYEQHGSEYFFQNVASFFQQDDLSIVNLEGPLTTADRRADTLYAFKGDPSFASILTSGSIEAVNLANNHSFDYGDEGYEETRLTLKESNITSFGYDETALLDIKGIKVGLVGIYELYDHLERAQQLKNNIAKVKKEGAQLIIVTFHWGNEKETTPDSNQITLGHMAIDEGAHVVVGHHSHVIQPVEKYNDRYIAYSMANFSFGGNSAPSDTDTFIFQQTFTLDARGQIAKDDAINLIPCYVSSATGYNNYQPIPVTGEDSRRILKRIQAPL